MEGFVCGRSSEFCDGPLCRAEGRTLFSRGGGGASGLRPRGVSVLVVLYRPHQRLHAQEAGRVAGPFAHRVDLGRCSLYALLSSSANGDNDSTHLTGFS